MKAGRSWPGLGQQVEAVDLLVAEEHLADVPRHALVDHAVAAAEPVEDLERALGEADRARAGRQRVVVVEQHDRHAALRQVDRQRQADRPGADHDDRVAHRRRGVLVGRAAVVEVAASGSRVRVGPLLAAPLERRRRRVSLRASSTSRRRARRSRCAGRGTASPRRSSASRRTACSGRRSPSGRTSASARRRCPCRPRSGPCPRPTPCLHAGVHVGDEVARAGQALRPPARASVSAAPRPGTSAVGFSAAMLSSVCGQSLK